MDDEAEVLSEEFFVRKKLIIVAAGAVFAFAPFALAHPADKYIAKAMLMTAASEVSYDSKQAFEQFNQGKGKFLTGMDGNIYVFCFDTGDGKFVAMGNANAKNLLGSDVRALKDGTGKAYGEEIFSAAQKREGEITEIGYLFQKPTDPKPAAKTSYVTRVNAEFACGVGYYN
jgi:signal transduction histidine kinase